MVGVNAAPLRLARAARVQDALDPLGSIEDDAGSACRRKPFARGQVKLLLRREPENQDGFRLAPE